MAKAVVVHNTPVVPEERCAVEHVLMARCEAIQISINHIENEGMNLPLVVLAPRAGTALGPRSLRHDH